MTVHSVENLVGKNFARIKGYVPSNVDLRIPPGFIDLRPWSTQSSKSFFGSMTGVFSKKFHMLRVTPPYLLTPNFSTLKNRTNSLCRFLI